MEVEKWVQPETAAQIALQFATLLILHMPVPMPLCVYHPFVPAEDGLV